MSYLKFKMYAPDTDLLYWCGKSINSMSREDLQQALRDANKIIEDQNKELYKLRRETEMDF